MLHSKVAMFSSTQAERTILTACTSSEVSITRMGVEELMSTLRRSSPSIMVRSRSPREIPLRLKSGSGRDDADYGAELDPQKFDRVGMLPYNKEFGPTPNISLHLQR